MAEKKKRREREEQETPRITVEIVPPTGPLSPARQRAREEAMLDLANRLLGPVPEVDRASGSKYD